MPGLLQRAYIAIPRNKGARSFTILRGVSKSESRQTYLIASAASCFPCFS